MRYRYEELGDEEFQQLIQTLLVRALGPGLRAMPLGKADGGRDALHGTAVYQVKFAGDPGKVGNSVSWLLASLDQEADKIRKLVARGARDYYIITNVGGTGHLDVGSIDRLDRELKRRERDWSIAVTPWWRETVDAQMSAAPNDVVRAFLRVLPPDQVMALAAMPEKSSRSLLQVGVVPPQARAFQARAETDAIERVLSAGQTAVLTPTSPVLTGLGGVGKTQIAVDYVRGAVQRGGLDLLVWITASSRDAIISAYAEAAALTESSVPGSADLAAARLLAWLATTTRHWLVVLDDLKAPAVLTGIWPPSSPTGKTIITTRRTDAALLGEGRRMIEVGVFTQTEAATFVCERLADYPGLADDIDGVVSDLGRLPLALSHATAFMADRRMTCAEYRSVFAKRERHLAELFPEAEALPDQYERTIAVTWSLSIDAADGLIPVGLARPLLEFASVLDPNGVPLEAFTTRAVLNWLAYACDGSSRANSTWQEITQNLARQGLHCLRRLSLVSADAETVRVHRLVQRATREGLGRERICDLMWLAADALLEIWPKVEEDPGLVRMLRANADVVGQHDPDALWLPQRHPLIFHHADSLADSGNVSDAIATYEQVLAQADQLSGPDDPATFKARYELARLRGRAGNPARAVEELRRLATDQIRVLGPHHPDVFSTRNNVGMWLFNSGDVTGSIQELQRCLDDAVRVMGPDDPVTLYIRGNVLTASAHVGDSADRVSELERFLAEQASALGLHHPDVLYTRKSLADLRGAAGDRARAIADLEELLIDHSRVLGPEHPHTLDVRQSLAIQRCGSEDVIRGAEELEQLIADRIHILGPEHLTILEARKSLSVAYGKLHGSSRAVYAYETLIQELRRVRDPDDPDILVAQQNLAIARGEAGGHADALADLERLHPDLVRILGPCHPHTLACRRNTAAMRCANGDPLIAVDELEQLLTEQVEILGPDHPEILISRRTLADVCEKLRHPARAMAAYESLIRDLIRITGQSHPDTLHARRQYALWLGRSGQPSQAVAELEQLLPDQLHTLGADHPETLATRQNLANRRAETGDDERSRKELEQLLTDQIRILGPDHRNTLITRSNLARMQADAGDDISAMAAYEQLYQDLVRTVGADDDDALLIEMNLATLRGQAGDSARAADDLEKLLVKLSRLLGADHPWTLDGRSTLAAFHAKAGNLAVAISELENVLKDQVRILGPENPATIATGRSIADLKNAEPAELGVRSSQQAYWGTHSIRQKRLLGPGVARYDG